MEILESGIGVVPSLYWFITKVGIISFLSVVTMGLILFILISKFIPTKKEIQSQIDTINDSIRTKDLKHQQKIKETVTNFEDSVKDFSVSVDKLLEGFTEVDKRIVVLETLKGIHKPT